MTDVPASTPGGAAPSSGATRANDAGRAESPSPAGWRTRLARLTPLPTLRAAGLLVIAAAVVWWAPVAVPAWLVAALAVAVIVIDAMVAVGPTRVAVDRELPPVAVLGSEGEVRLRLHHPGRRTARLSLADSLAPGLGAARRRHRVAIPAGARRVVSTTLTPHRRGTFRPSTVTVRSTGPLGLGARQADHHVPGRIEVHPGFRSRAATELRIRRQRVLDEGLRALRARGGGAQFEALRDYVQGDDVRHVDWVASGRRGHPVVRTYRAERNQQVLALLDTGRLSAGLVEDVPRLDHALDAVLALATVALHSGDRIGLLAFDQQTRAVVPARGSAAQLRVLSRALHSLQPALVESDYRGAFRAALARFRRQATLVLFTDLADEALQEQLLPALPLLVRDHAVVVVAVTDPALSRLRDTGPDRPGDAYLAAAATEALAARERAAGRLRRLGASVVDAPPAALAGRVADAYLDTKAAGR